MAQPPPDPSEDALIGLNRLATVARLLSGAAHDVNNALQVISGTVEILESRPDVPPSLAEALTRLRTQSARAAKALAQVLVFTKAPRGSRSTLSMQELAEESLALRDFSIRHAHLSARLEADASKSSIVVGNRGDLQQALLNLLMNAEQALSGTNGTIVVRLTSEDGTVVLRVIDEGRGVVLDPPERAFHPFVSTHDPFEASGLGLWAARSLVEQHAGTLTNESSPTGAVFVMRLPAAART